MCENFTEHQRLLNMQNLKQSHFKTIDNLKFILAIAVVFIHCRIPTADSLIMNSSFSLSCLVEKLFSEVLPSVAVPSFYIISGFLFFYSLQNWKTNTYIHKLQRRISTLIVPYLLWNIIPILLILLRVIGGSIIAQQEISSSAIISVLTDNFSYHTFWDIHRDDHMFLPMNMPLWFLRELILLVFVSPLIYIFIRYTKNIGIILFVILYLSGVSVPYIRSQFFFALVFYTLGSWTAFNLRYEKLFVGIRNYSWVLHVFSVICVVLATFSLLSSGTLIEPILRVFRFVGSASLFFIVYFIVDKFDFSFNDRLLKSTFFIYAAHMGLSYRDFVRNVIFCHCPEGGDFMICVKYFLVPVIVILLCVTTYALLSYISPKFTKILCGR